LRKPLFLQNFNARFVRRIRLFYWLLPGILLLVCTCEKKNDNGNNAGVLQLVGTIIGPEKLVPGDTLADAPVDRSIVITFSSPVDTGTVRSGLELLKDDAVAVEYSLSFDGQMKTITLDAESNLEYMTLYALRILPELKGSSGEQFPGIEYFFRTQQGEMHLNSIQINGKDFNGAGPYYYIDYKDLKIEAEFSAALDPVNYQSFFTLSGNPDMSFSLSGQNRKVTMTSLEALKDYSIYYLVISSNLTSAAGYIFSGFSNQFITSLDSSYKFPEVSDGELLTLVQEQTFKYFWDFAHPVSGLARERNTSGEIVAIGGSGFGIMALAVGVERGFVTRQEALDRMQTILDFLENADRFHGAWPHWMNGSTGKVHPFSTKDDGADLVETSYMAAGLLAFRQYLDPDAPGEQSLVDQINRLLDGIEWDWFTRGEEALYWHWSPDYGWDMNMKIRGWNEALITYVMAATSAAHGIDSAVYHSGWASNGGIVLNRQYYGYNLPLSYEAYGGPLFFCQYSFLGIDPRNLHDRYADYWEQVVNHSLINWSYCVDNPKNYVGYSESCWGLTASDNQYGYSAHSPTNDLGVISPTAAVSSIPYTPEQSLKAIRFFYYLLGDRLWGPYGFYDAFNATVGWYATSNIAIDQGPMIVMIENYRTGLIWDLFMSAPEVQSGLTKLGFTFGN
jgi:hypothetical protein